MVGTKIPWQQISNMLVRISPAIGRTCPQTGFLRWWSIFHGWQELVAPVRVCDFCELMSQESLEHISVFDPEDREHFWQICQECSKDVAVEEEINGFFNVWSNESQEWVPWSTETKLWSPNCEDCGNTIHFGDNCHCSECLEIRDRNIDLVGNPLG